MFTSFLPLSKNYLASVSLFLFLILFISCNSNGLEESKQLFCTGKIISILDGDTYDLLIKDNKTLRVRIEGIDAPEKGMSFYRVSKNYLSKLCFEKNVRLEIMGKDIHERTLAFSYLDDGTELSHEMVKQGLAWHFKKYSSDTVLIKLRD